MGYFQIMEGTKDENLHKKLADAYGAGGPPREKSERQSIRLLSKRSFVMYPWDAHCDGIKLECDFWNCERIALHCIAIAKKPCGRKQNTILQNLRFVPHFIPRKKRMNIKNFRVNTAPINPKFIESLIGVQ
jgi:hypothetical protein